MLPNQATKKANTTTMLRAPDEKNRRPKHDMLLLAMVVLSLALSMSLSHHRRHWRLLCLRSLLRLP